MRGEERALDNQDNKPWSGAQITQSRRRQREAIKDGGQKGENRGEERRSETGLEEEG